MPTPWWKIWTSKIASNLPPQGAEEKHINKTTSLKPPKPLEIKMAARNPNKNHPSWTRTIIWTKICMTLVSKNVNLPVYLELMGFSFKIPGVNFTFSENKNRSWTTLAFAATCRRTGKKRAKADSSCLTGKAKVGSPSGLDSSRILWVGVDFSIHYPIPSMYVLFTYIYN